MTIALQALHDRRPDAGEDETASGTGLHDRSENRGGHPGHERGTPGETPPGGAGLRYEVAGWLDAEASHEVRDVEQAPNPDTVVEIDLQKCEGMDDFGFGSLVGLIRRAREHRARVQVRGADAEVRDELERTGVARLVDLLPAGSGR
jgi:anti-anti-sigma regulatory factor